MTREEIKEEIEVERNGIIPLIYKRIICILWRGHNYIPVSQKQKGKGFLNANTVKNSMYIKE